MLFQPVAGVLLRWLPGVFLFFATVVLRKVCKSKAAKEIVTQHSLFLFLVAVGAGGLLVGPGAGCSSIAVVVLSLLYYS